MILNPQRLIFRRFAAPVNWDDGTPSTVSRTLRIVAGVRPFGMQEIDLLPEGVDLEDSVWFLSREPLHTANPRDQTAADEVLYRGDWYVIHRATLAPPPLKHWESIGVRKDPDAERTR